MKKYEFVTLTEKEFDKFSNNHEQTNFMQSIKMNNYYKLKNKKTVLLGVKLDDKVVAASILNEESTFLGYKKYAIYKGPILDYKDINLLEFFLKSIKLYCKNNKGYMLSLDPNIIERERDSEANIIEGGIDNRFVIDYLKKYGFKKSKTDVQIKWMYCLNINNRNIEELFKNFDSTTRNLINKAITKYQLNVRDLKKEELKEFKSITEETCNRRLFADKSLEYYKDMYDTFGEDVVFKYCELNCDKYIDFLNDEIKLLNDRLNKLSDAECNNKKKENILFDINNDKKYLQETKDIKKRDGNIIPLACAMFMLYGNEVVYLFSGSRSEYMKYNAQYLIQYDIIKYAADNKYDRYNFYGIYDVFNPKGKDYGVYKFKKGFNGYVRELIGEYDINLNRSINLLSKLKHSLGYIKRIIKK